jgi:hypothetical protein
MVMVLSQACLAADPISMTFAPDATEHKFRLADLPTSAPLSTDWTDAHFLVIEWRATASERFHLELFTPDGMVAKRIGPFQNTWVRASVPLEYFRKPAREGFDLAATFNKHRNSYWININFGGWAPCKTVDAIGFQMDVPITVNGQPPKLEIRSVALAKEDPGDAVLDPKVVIDQFGQWAPADWPGKAHTLDDLKKAWSDEDATLKPGPFEYDLYGGYRNQTAPGKPTGFFKVEQIEGKWWFVDPDGHLFYSAGVNGIGTASATPTAGREGIFETLPRQISAGSATAPAGRGRGGSGFGGASFYTLNLQRRFGIDVDTAWGQLTFRRMEAWGLNTVAGFGAAPPAAISQDGRRKPYTIMLRWQAGGGAQDTVMGMPDVYAPSFEERIDQVAAQRCAALKDDPYLLGYFVGNEPPWPGRESLFCDAILAGPETTMKARLTEHLGPGDTPERRKEFAYEAFSRYLNTVTAAVRKHDPHHLTLGIRLGGEVPDEVIEACQVFDVCSINVYNFAIDRKFLDKVATLTGRPIVVGEFHFGVPEHGMGGGLRQVADQTQRGAAYQYYVEHAAAHPNVIGTHWFQWIDQPATGRNDGENYNIGFVDVTDRPYAGLIDGVVQTHKRLYDVHAGKMPPTDQVPEGQSTAEIRREHPTMVPEAK